MKKVIMVLVLGLLLVGVNLFAADGDFIIEGNVGIGTTAPGAKFDVRGDAVFNEDGGDYDLRIEGDTNENLFIIDAAKDAIGIGAPVSPYSGSLLNVTSTASDNDKKTAANFYAVQTGNYNTEGMVATGRRDYSGEDSIRSATGVSARAMAYQTGNLIAEHPGAGLMGVNSELVYNFSSDKDATITNAVGVTSAHRIYGNWNGTETLTVTNMTGYRSVGFDTNWTPMAGDTININTMSHFRAYDSITTTGAGTINMTNQVGLYIESMSAATNNFGIVLDGDGEGSDLVFGAYKETRLYGKAGDFIIDTSGNVGIGTTSPQATLDVNGYAKLNKYSAPPAQCDNTNDGSIALTSGYRMCACNGSSWVYTSDGKSTCSW